MSALNRILAPSPVLRGVGLEDVLLAILLAFVLGQLMAWVYQHTHSGLSYSKNFVQSIVLLTVVVTVAMMVIGNNIVIAFGLIGALAVIRFRNILKDTRDTAFIFMALVVGMASGTGSYHLAVTGTVFYCLIVILLYWSFFGGRSLGDGFIRFQIDPSGDRPKLVRQVMKRHCYSARLTSQRIQENGAGEMAYHLVVKFPERSREMVDELRALEGISNVVFALQEEQDEI